MEHNRQDVSAKELILDEPACWADRFGIGTPGPVSVIESEITTLTASTDRMLYRKAALEGGIRAEIRWWFLWTHRCPLYRSSYLYPTM
jgi:hypothetical protein